MQFIKPGTKIDFIGKWTFFVSISIILVILSIILLLFKGAKYGVDFAGGNEVHVKFNKAIDIGDLRSALLKGGLQGIGVVQFGEAENREFLIRTSLVEFELEKVTQGISQILVNKYGKDSYEVLRVDAVGPKVGSDLKKAGIYAVLYALLGILIYIAIRFDFRYSPGAVIALIHDVLITVGIFVVLEKEFDLTIIAALLTIIGYSLNDTIVVFDRIRENVARFKAESLVKIVNSSVNETLSRTILTSFTTLIVVLALFIYGGAIIHNFAFAMLVGIVVGTYSSIFIASPSFIYLDKLMAKKKII